jgi:hypothetical protein
MQQRCYDVKHDHYADYGGRGIVVDSRWRGPDGFVRFLADMGDRPSKGHSIERKDNDGPYSKENCCWATRKQQMRNCRRSRRITAFGRTQTLVEWAEETGLLRSTIQWRLKDGKTPEQAVSKEDGRRLQSNL